MREKRKLESSMSKLPNTSTNPYSRPQTFGKAVSRIKKSLPSSPRKKQAVVEKLASDFGIINPSTKPEKKNGLSKDVTECVKAFYYRDDISRQLPGKKDVKSIKNLETNKRVLLQKRLLMYNLKDAFNLFKIDNPEIEIGLSKFCELRPLEVELVGSKDQQVCCCPYCENFDFMLKVCKWKKNNIKNVNDLIELIVCDKNEKKCMRQDCTNCPSQIKSFIEKELDINEEIYVNQWKKGILEEITFDPKNFTEEMILQTTNVFKHIYNVSRQSKELRKQKDGLQPGQMLMQIDFSQNYQIKHQNEVMAAHWKTDQDLSVTIYTAVVYFRRAENDDLETKSYAVISDSNQHTSSVVKIFNQRIIKDILENHKFQIKKAIIWSDGASAHFKNRYSMALMLSNSVFCEWNFTASYHGKGPHDGVGAVLKRHVWKKVLQGQKIVKNAEEFFNEVNTADINIKCIFVDAQEIIREVEEIEKNFDKINELKGIKSCHSIKKTGSANINMYINTGDDIPFKEHINLINSNKTDSVQNNIASVELEKYYSVYYDDNWYIGRITAYENASDMCKIKFLHETDYGFKWPTSEDLQMVNRKFILSGPIELSGNLPFHINYEIRKEIVSLYKKYKKGHN